MNTDDVLEDPNFEEIVKQLDKQYPGGIIPILHGETGFIKILTDLGYKRFNVSVNRRPKSYLVKEGVPQDEVVAAIPIEDCKYIY